MPSRLSYCSAPAIAAAVSVLAAFPAAADVTSRQSGHWSNPTTWQGERVPDGLDHVTVSSGHEVIYDQASTRVSGVTIEAGGLLRFDPLGGDNTLETDANVVVRGELEMRPGAAAEVHTLRFVDVDESAFQGGGNFPCGTQPVASDVGLWVLCDGLLDVVGERTDGWLRLAGGALGGDTTLALEQAPVGWRAGDLLVIAPSEPLSVGSRAWTGFEERIIVEIDGATVTLDAPLAHDHPANTGFRDTYTAEVMNLSRNVRIEGTNAGNSHVLIVSSQPQTIHYAELRHVGVGGATSGRYGMHFHRAGDGSRGTTVRGVSISHGDNHAYVPHTSHGITFEDVIAYDFGQEPFWWDVEDLTDDMVWDHAIAAKAVDAGDQRYTGFLLGAGHNMTVKNSVAVGVIGGVQSGGFHWAAPVNDEPNIWNFMDNIAHNNRANGTFVWQNCPHQDVCAGPHIIDGFVAYNNALNEVNDNGRGINHGAYQNSYQYYRLDLFNNEEHDIEIHARSRNKEKDEFVNQERTDGYVNAWDTFGVESIVIVGHASAAVEPTLLIDGTVDDAVYMSETYFDETTCKHGLFDFVRTGLEPEDVTLVPNEDGSGMCPDSVIRVQRADGAAYQLTDTNEDGVLEVETIAAFYDDPGAEEDTDAPTVPQDLVATAVGTDQIDLSWTASTDNVGVTRYRIYRDGAFLTEVTGTSYSDTGLASGTTYTYEVSAVDAAGNESALSAPASAKTEEPDTTPPPAPTGLTVTGTTDTTVDLAWDAVSDESGIEQYDVERDGAIVAAVVDATTYKDTDLSPSTTYAYRVRAVDGAGNAGDWSEVVEATTDKAAVSDCAGCAHHWPLDEGSGTVAADVAGGLDGTLVGGPVWTTGYLGAALSFDGVDDRVEIPGAAALAYPFTVCAWFNAPLDAGAIVSISDNTDTNRQVVLVLSNDKVVFRMRGDSSWATAASDGDYTAGVWHHACGVAVSETERIAYLDGVGGTADTESRDIIGWNATDIGRLGDSTPEADSYIDGLVDDVRIWHEALSASEIADLAAE